MDTNVWNRSMAAVGDVDRREQHLIRRVGVGLVVGATLLAMAFALGVARPGLSLAGSSGGSANRDTALAEVSIEVDNWGVWPEQVVSVDTHERGLTVTDAVLVPDRLGPGGHGTLNVSLTVDCSVRTDQEWQEVFDTGSVAGDGQQPRLTVRTQRPWGSVARTWDTDAVGVVAFNVCLPDSLD